MAQPSVEAFLELSSSLAVLEISPAAQQLYGLDPQAVLGRPLSLLFASDGARLPFPRRNKERISHYARDKQSRLCIDG